MFTFTSPLYLIEILHQTTTPTRARAYLLCCILSKFYIKPQRNVQQARRLFVVSYRNSTSNHNNGPSFLFRCIVVSYRNSTSNHNLGQLFGGMNALYLIEILHQTTTLRFREAYQLCCILSKFYIKPQLRRGIFTAFRVVSYRNSTSNHNSSQSLGSVFTVVSYRNSTSNHNLGQLFGGMNAVVSYRNSTSNHNSSVS